MVSTIRVNGAERKVINTLSSGPGQEPHTFQIAGGWVEKIGTRWQVQFRGQFAVQATVEIGGAK